MSIDQKHVIELCRRLVGLVDDPQPGLATWNIACADTADELRAALTNNSPADSQGHDTGRDLVFEGAGRQGSDERCDVQSSGSSVALAARPAGVIAAENLEYGKAEDWIAVDLDGTLAQYNSGDYKRHGPYYIGPPIPMMLARVKRWLDDGIEVRIFTARVDGGVALPPDSPALEAYSNVNAIKRAIEEWCVEHIGRVLAVTNQKDYGTLEIWDDRAVAVERNTGRRI